MGKIRKCLAILAILPFASLFVLAFILIFNALSWLFVPIVVGVILYVWLTIWGFIQLIEE